MTRTRERDVGRGILPAVVARIVIPLSVVSLLLFAGALANLAMVLREPVEEQRFVPEFSFSHRANLDYSVALKPNGLFDRTVLEAGQVYFTQLVRHLEVRFTYSFEGDPAVPVSGSYGVNAVLSSGEERVREGQGPSTRPLWEKRFELIPPTRFEGRGSVDLSTVFYLDPARFREIAARIEQEIGATTGPTSVRVESWVKTSADAPTGPLSKELVTDLVIPVGQAYFRVSGTPEKSEGDTLGRTVVVTREQVVRQRELAREVAIASGALTSLTAPAALYRVVRGIRRRRLVTGERSALRRLSGRLADARPDWQVPEAEAMVMLASLDDLVRVADEVGRPVIRYVSPSGRQHFFLFDGTLWYAHEGQVDEAAAFRAGVEPERAR